MSENISWIETKVRWIFKTEKVSLLQKNAQAVYHSQVIYEVRHIKNKRHIILQIECLYSSCFLMLVI
jgi:hypothetical protein